MVNYTVDQKFPDEDKPREKLMTYGPDILSNAELLAIIFVTGTRQEGVMDLASRCLKEYGSRSITTIKDVKKVQNILGLGDSKACQIVAAFELGRRFFKETNERMPFIRGPEDVYTLYKFMKRLKREEVRALYLNSRQRVVHDELLSIGGIGKVEISPQIVLQPAVELMCPSFILVHNHPSGDIEPSRNDLDLTLVIKNAAKVLGIKMLDSIIIGEGWGRVIRS